MRRTKAWWGRLTKEERSELGWLEQELRGCTCQLCQSLINRRDSLRQKAGVGVNDNKGEELR